MRRCPKLLFDNPNSETYYAPMFRKGHETGTFNTGTRIIVTVFIFLSIFIGRQSCAQSSLSDYRLIGTIDSRNLVGAVLQDTEGKQFFYQLHAKLPDGSEITHVHDRSISLRTADGTISDMYISHEAHAAPPSTRRRVKLPQ